MNIKKQRREAAQKKAKQKRLPIMAVCAACLIAVITSAIVYVATRPDSRVFAVAGGQSVTLYENGRFSARLFHDINFSGTFAENLSGGVTTISFTHDGNTVSTQIIDDALILPVPWRANCRLHSHETEFPLVQNDSGLFVQSDNEYTFIGAGGGAQNDNEYNEDTVSDTSLDTDLDKSLETEYQNFSVEGDYIIALTEADFNTQIQEIYQNPNNFLGRTIRYEGMFLSLYWGDETIYFVARLMEGCCGMHGFEVYLNEFPYFDDETWVEVTGILEEFYVEEAHHYFLRLNVISLVER